MNDRKKTNPECKHCGLLKSTCDETGCSCVIGEIHDFGTTNEMSKSTNSVVDEAKKEEQWEIRFDKEFTRKSKELDPKEIIEWCEREIKEYQKLIVLIRKNHIGIATKVLIKNGAEQINRTTKNIGNTKKTIKNNYV